MTGQPTFAMPGGFLGATGDSGGGITIAGIPFDIATTNRPGARFAPEAIRRASKMLVDGDHPTLRRSVALGLNDTGDFAIALGDVPASLALIEQQASQFEHLVTLGGDHSIALPLLRALSKRLGRPLGLVHFDAHVDTWPDSFGQVYGHGSCFYHAINEGIVDPKRMIQIGIRSPVQADVLDWTLQQGVTILSAQDVHERGVESVSAQIRQVVGDLPSYLTFDIDALDPAFAPGTGTPEIGGLATWQAQAILRRLNGMNFAGMDMVEVAPAYDHAEVTALAAATLVYEYLALVQRKA